MLNWIDRALLALVITLAPAVAGAEIVDPELFKADILSYCKKQPVQKRRTCLVDSGNRIMQFEEAVQTAGGKRSSQLCARSINETTQDRMHTYLTCVTDHITLRNSHPEPVWIDAALRLEEMRPNWVSTCLQSPGANVSPCIRKQELGFYQFWQRYLKLSLSSKEDARRQVNRMSPCITKDLISTDFSSFDVCFRR